jgi:hypothetical protein
MPDIRFVCLSDTHFGADNSLLTYLAPGQQRADPMQQSPVLEQLILCLRTLTDPCQEKPTLILNGDTLELALTTDEQAAMAFERFIELAFPRDKPPLFKNRIIYLPGNHDHHLWETAREAQYLVYLAQEARPEERLKAPWHATNLFSQLRKNQRKITSGFLDTLAKRRGLSQVSFEVAYPSLGLMSADERRAVLFIHGHFAEPIYSLVTELTTMLFPERVKPTQVWDIEAENFAWIDFFWSALGRSGGAGKNVELIYDRLQSPDATARLLQNLTKGIVQRFMPGLLAFAKSWGLRAALRALLGHMSNLEALQKGNGPLTPEVQKGLKEYVTGPLLRQIQSELSSSPPAEVTLVFGHTHKPFESVESYGGFAEDVKLYNSGGWVIDNMDVTAQGGWAVILVDEQMNVASLRGAGDAPSSGVQVAEPKGTGPNPLCTALRASIDSSKAPWTDFARELEKSIVNHRDNLKRKIES